MRRVLCVVLVLVIVIGIAGQSLADKHNKGAKVQEEAARRNITLITREQAQEIAAKKIGRSDARCKELKLRNEADDYYNGSNFQPVYKMEFVSGRDEYEINIDAVTGEILKFKLDD